MNNLKKIYNNIVYLNKKINPNLLASSFAFYLILTLIPLVELICLILSKLDISIFYSNNMMETTIVTTIIFIINILFTSSKLVHNLSIISEEIYYNLERKSRFKLRLRSLLLTIILIILILIMVVLLIYVSYLKIVVLNKYYFLLNVCQYILTYIFISLFIAVVYKMITPIKTKIKNTFNVSVIITTLLYIVSIIYQKVIRTILIKNYEQLYGSFAGTITTILFLYVASYIFIVGICFLLYQKEYKTRSYNI